MAIRLRPAFLAAALLATAAPGASAHVVAAPNEGAAGSYFRTALRITHGCAGAATVAVTVKLPPGIVTAKPQAKPGWAVAMTRRPLDRPADNGHGKPVAEVIDEITWRGGRLADSEFDEFGLVLKLPPGPAGTTLYLPVVQECEGGAQRWTEIPTGKQRWGDLASPAPFIRLLAPAHAH
jgi:uncharacterized protein YcnI